jgi:hypothetical protein
MEDFVRRKEIVLPFAVAVVGGVALGLWIGSITARSCVGEMSGLGLILVGAGLIWIGVLLALSGGAALLIGRWRRDTQTTAFGVGALLAAGALPMSFYLVANILTAGCG